MKFSKLIFLLFLIVLPVAAFADDNGNHSGGGNNGSGGGNGGGGVPLDGGLSLLVVAGVGYGIKKVIVDRKKTSTEAIK